MNTLLRKSEGVHQTGATPASIWQHLGVAFSPHMFRHFAGTLAVRLSPGNYELARQLLHHKSTDTTATFYVASESAMAARVYDRMVLDLIAPGEKKPVPRRRRGDR